ncbi:hypothetical protein [Clostridium tunisiense]|uniref:hypothetical protein n=1 Tax=Clostridium tunisiense TaxID=219748 RepID=UPI000305659E|nr:hypothetical protein [Clostridium tunisiense]
MRAVSRDRFKLLFISIALLAGLFIIGNLAFGKAKITGMYTSGTKVVKVDDTEAINRSKKYNTPYAHKVKENDKFYLKYFAFEGGQPKNGTFTMTSEQYEELVEGKEYWFNIEFDKPDDDGSGKVKTVYKEDPMKK